MTIRGFSQVTERDRQLDHLIGRARTTRRLLRHYRQRPGGSSPCLFRGRAVSSPAGRYSARFGLYHPLLAAEALTIARANSHDLRITEYPA